MVALILAPWETLARTEKVFFFLTVAVGGGVASGLRPRVLLNDLQ